MNHKLNLPWRAEGQTVYDCNGMPVAIGLRYTSIAKDESTDEIHNVTYNSTDYAGAIRARLIAEWANKLGEALE
jgi:hypothetical protein